MNRHWQEYQRTLTKELGSELATEFVDSLYAQSAGSVEMATRFFYDLGMMWAPLMHAWSAWVAQHAQGTIAIILRDAKPLTALAQTAHWKQLYLNRVICGIADELSGDLAHGNHLLLRQYLSQSGCGEHFTFVDSGCYGTVVLELHKIGVTFQPLFFFSKNPSIRGFINECGVTMEEGEILNDSLECCFPHLCPRPSELIEVRGEVQPVLHLSDSLSVRFGKAAMCGVRDAPTVPQVSVQEAIASLLSLARLAKNGQFTGILGHTSPEWSHKDAFLAEWPADLCWA